MKMGTWRDHFAYNEGVAAMSAGGQTIGVATAGLVFLPDAQKLSKVDGLSDFGLSAADYDSTQGLLLLGYSNGNIDLVTLSGTSISRVSNIADVKNDAVLSAKGINRFLRIDGYIFVATDFGILKIEDKRIEINDNFTVDENGGALMINDLIVFNDTVVAATPQGLYVCAKDHPQLSYFGSWRKLQSGTSFVSLALSEGQMYTLDTSGNCLKFSNLLSSLVFATGVKMLCNDGENCWMATTSNLRNITSGDSISIDNMQPAGVHVSNAGELFIADAQRGFLKYEYPDFTPIQPNGPQRNAIAAMDEQDGRVVIAGAGFFSEFGNTGWENALYNELQQVKYVSINPVATQNSHIATSNGILAFSGSGLVTQGELQGKNLGGLEFNSKGQLFAFSSADATPVNVRKEDGSWVSLTAPEFAGKAITGVTSSQSNNFWGIVGGTSLFVYTPSNDIYDTSDDKSNSFAISLRNDFAATPTSGYTLSADRSGEVWISTNKGAAVYTPQSSMFTSSLEARRIHQKTSVEGYVAYLLEFEVVNAIEIDGGNRKWFGTRNAGVFLETPDGSEQLQAFNTTNSPLPSDNVLDVKANSRTGEVFILTDKGLVSYKADATVGSTDFSSVKIYPNPVRPNMNLATIEGLMEDASVKITDASGNLVYEGSANGGSFTWDLQSLNGHRVTTGVYFVFMVSTDGASKKVGKILIVR
jgi:hypothetical protein